MRIAVIIKQVPRFDGIVMGQDGRLVRSGVELEMNPFCRRAVAMGVELTRRLSGECIVLSLGPPEAEDVLREAVAWGADEGVLISDQAFAGSDTLATARALASAIRKLGPFDLVLTGRNSVDADTGQVAPELAQLLDYPMLNSARTLEVRDDTVSAHLESEGGWLDAEVRLPAIITCAERLCEPAKVKKEGRDAVPARRIRHWTSADLGPGPWGEAASPTTVGEIRRLEVTRRRRLLDGPVDEQVAIVVAEIGDSGLLDQAEESPMNRGSVADGWVRGAASIVVVLEDGLARMSRELLGAAARLAADIKGHVTAFAPDGAFEPATLLGWGADHILLLRGSQIAEDVAHAIGQWGEDRSPWAVLAPSTLWGREVAARFAARSNAGLVGDAIDLVIDQGRLVSYKPALGGLNIAQIAIRSPIQMVTVRPGVLQAPEIPRQVRGAREIDTIDVAARSRVRILASGTDDQLESLDGASVIIGVGLGVDPKDYPLLEPLRAVLGAELGASRKVTDRGWLPRSRQIGITGRSVAPRLYIAIGLSGNSNHMVGVSTAGTIVAINRNPDAPVFDSCDLGIVGDWREVVPKLSDSLSALESV